MVQTAEGAQKVRARKAGISIEDCILKETSGYKWCYKCKQWLLLIDFCNDRSRYDGKDAICLGCRKVLYKKTYKPKPRVSKKGYKYPASIREHMGRPPGFISEFRGRERTPEDKKKISQAVRKIVKSGPECPSFKDGKTVERRGIRFSAEYKRWRFDVFAKNYFTCQECGDKRGHNLRAHHIKSFADFSDERLNVDNGITLCTKCHDLKHAAKNGKRRLKNESKDQNSLL